MAQLLIIAASSLFVLFGSLHGLFTLKDIRRPTYFTPRDPALRVAMQASGIAFHSDVNLWKAWLGFNLTHSLGLFLFGAAFLYIGVSAPDAFRTSPGLQVTAVLVSAAYLAISTQFFFWKPTMGTAATTILFLAAAMS